MENEINFDRKFIAFAILGIVIILASVGLSFTKLAAVSFADEEINSYKKAIYESLVCQYSCPTEGKEYNGEIVQFLVTSCTTTCIEELKTKGFERDEYPADVLDDDNLLLDIDNLLKVCREQTMKENNIPDNSAFYACAIENLSSLKENYNYLK